MAWGGDFGHLLCSAKSSTAIWTSGCSSQSGKPRSPSPNARSPLSDSSARRSSDKPLPIRQPTGTRRVNRAPGSRHRPSWGHNRPVCRAASSCAGRRCRERNRGTASRAAPLAQSQEGRDSCDRGKVVGPEGRPTNDICCRLRSSPNRSQPAAPDDLSNPGLQVNDRIRSGPHLRRHD